MTGYSNEGDDNEDDNDNDGGKGKRGSDGNGCCGGCIYSDEQKRLGR